MKNNDTKKCSKCGEYVNGNLNHCPYCGKVLHKRYIVLLILKIILALILIALVFLGAIIGPIFFVLILPVLSTMVIIDEMQKKNKTLKEVIRENKKRDIEIRNDRLSYQEKETIKNDEDYTFVKKSKTKKRYSDEELDAYDLEDDEKELVQNDEYDPWNFEEEDLDEDDYHRDDD